MNLASLGRNTIVLAAVVLVGAGAAATAVAATGDTSQINGCVSSTGALRVVSAGTACKKGETPLGWNQQGTQGEPGAAGPQRPAGPAGPAGDADVTYVTETLTVPAGPNAIGDLPPVACPANTEVVNGTAQAASGEYTIVTNGYIDTEANGWVFLYGNDGSSVTLAAKVACV